jgi:hypothetical protein
MLADESIEGACLLPGGLVMDEGRCLRRVRLRPLIGSEEDWLAQYPGAPSAVAVTRLLSSCVVDLDDAPVTKDLIRQFLVADRDYLILQLRRLTVGEEFQAVLTCPACNRKMDVAFSAGEIPVEARPQTSVWHTVQVPEPGGRAIRFRFPTGGDQEAVLGLPNNRANETLLERCVPNEGGRPLTPQEQQVVVDAMEELAPQVNPELDLRCPECSDSFVVPFDSTAFFLDEMRVGSSRLLREVHALAFYYHWSETDILRLQRDRRRTYLSLLSEALQRE